MSGFVVLESFGHNYFHTVWKFLVTRTLPLLTPKTTTQQVRDQEADQLEARIESHLAGHYLREGAGKGVHQGEGQAAALEQEEAGIKAATAAWKDDPDGPFATLRKGDKRVYKIQMGILPTLKRSSKVLVTWCHRLKSE